MSADAPSLRQAAHLLTVDATWLLDQAQWLTRAFDQLPHTGFRGAAAEAAVARLHRLAGPLETPPAQMLRVAQVLSLTAGLREDLDLAVRQVSGLANGALGASTPVTVILRDLRALGDLLDWRCARQIDALCTPSPLPPPARLADTPDLGVDAIHELHLMDLPDSLRPLLGAPDVRILELSDAHLVAAVGDLTTAGSATTIVSGVGSADPAGWPVQLDRARTIAQATGGAAVVWINRPVPPSLPHALAGSPAVAAGADLQDFQREMARRFPEQHRIVLGHSYGTVVVGTAASGSGGLHADDVVLLGSPGTGAWRAGDFRLHGTGGVYAMTNPPDPIVWATNGRAGVHGPDPTSPGFGAQVWPGDRNGDHSSYWEDPVLLERLAGLAQKKPSAFSE